SHYSSPPDFYTLSLHDALPISIASGTAFFLETFVFRSMTKSCTESAANGAFNMAMSSSWILASFRMAGWGTTPRLCPWESLTNRSEEHSSELQSRGHLVCRLLL